MRAIEYSQHIALTGTFTVSLLLRSHRPSPRAYIATAVALKGKTSKEDLLAAKDTLTVPLHEEDQPQRPMTKAQISRSAAQAVRLCTPSDALYIVNSLHFSTFGALRHEFLRVLDETHKPKASSRLSTYIPFKPIEFGEPISPRLSAHCFLHKLLRQGHAFQAARLAELMMEHGIRIRTFTLETMVAALCTAEKASLFSQARNAIRPMNVYDPQQVALHKELFSQPGNEVACRILQHARRFGQQRTERMYDALINACLLQGEILAAALLFSFLVKDWQARSARQRALAAADGQTDSMDAKLDRTTVDHPSIKPGTGSRLKHTNISWDLLPLPYPSIHMLSKVTHRIEASFAEDPGPEGGEEYLQEPLQALAVLAMLVEHGQMHTGRLSPIVRAMYSCPKTNHHIRIRHRKGTQSRHAHRYFHQVLLKMVKSLKDPAAMPLPPLDIRACNSLLHYTLRHRLSPSLASDVLEYMVKERKLQPSASTLNTLIRSGTILRRQDISETAVQILSQLGGFEEFGKPLDLLRPKIEVKRIHEERAFPGSDLSQALDRVRTEPLRIPAALLYSGATLSADEATVVSYISHLTSTGKPHETVRVLWQILPEIALVDHPSWGEMPVSQRKVPIYETDDGWMKRGVMLGPRFFTVVLNALRKAGTTGLAERVWLFAKAAEEASWREDFCPGAAPWYLPVAAYTCMLQCYAAESRKGLPGKALETDTQVLWQPTTRNYVRGWARLVYQQQRSSQRWDVHGTEDKRLRYEAARLMARRLFRAMTYGGAAVIRSCLEAGRYADALRGSSTTLPPQPDARFFNAALDLYRPWPGVSLRRPRTTRARWRRFLRWARDMYADEGAMAHPFDELLQEIGEAMVRSGRPVPPGFRHLFVGRFPPATAHNAGPPTLDRTPYVYPRPTSPFRAHALPTHKTRGLPIRRAPPKRAIRRTRETAASNTDTPVPSPS